MSIWKTLGKIGLMAGGALAAPITGGASLIPVLAAAGGGALAGGKVADALGLGGQAAGALASGRAAGRVSEAGVNQDQDRLALQRYQTQVGATNAQNSFNLGAANYGLNAADADLSRRKFALDAPGQRARNSVRGDILANAQDVSIATPFAKPSISGGLRPSMFSGNTRALGSAMSADALAGQQKGDTFDALPSTPSYVAPPSAPGLTPLPQAGGVDKFLTTAGTLGSFADLLAKYKLTDRRPFQEPDETAGYG